jgi:hypothetical protein
VHALPLLAVILAAQPAPLDFDTEVLPVLTRAGCNAGSCHGAASGRGGFRLSLWGSDPFTDYETIVRELEGRRVNLARPARSLLLLKPTRQLAHGGGRRLDPDGDGARRVLAWIEAGAPRLQKRRLDRFTVTPSDKVLDNLDESVSLKATAHFDDGTTADVTRWAVLTATDPASVAVNADGKAKVLRRGQHTVLVRYLDRVEAVRLTAPLGTTAVNLADASRHNFIDDEVLASLATLRLPPAPPCDDSTFLRRVALDLTGTLPSPDEVRSFLVDRRPDKRARTIDRLLASHDFIDYWSLKWGNLLRISSAPLGKEGAKAFHVWMREQVARGTPLDVVARELVTALGDGRRVGPANFSRIPGDARTQAEYISRVFMGVRMQCANCHNHPLDRWTQDDYHGLAAVFARLERGPVVRLVSHGEVIHPRSGEPARPRLPGLRFLDAEKDGRRDFARWLVSADNPYFARAAINRLWKEMMGRGLVDPVDDLRATNPATHPRLLERLAEDFVKHGCDTRRTLRLIANSSAYQRGGPTNELNRSDDRFYSRALVRPLPAEVRADAIAAVTGISDRFGDLPLGTRAITLFDSQVPAPALDVLGRCSRAGPCEEDAASSGGLARTLHLINGPLLNAKIDAAEGRLRKLFAGKHSDAELVEEFYLRALGRSPDANERAFWAKNLTGARREDERREAFEDFLWGLLTSREFTTNH